MENTLSKNQFHNQIIPSETQKETPFAILEEDENKMLDLSLFQCKKNAPRTGRISYFKFTVISIVATYYNIMPCSKNLFHLTNINVMTI